MKFLVFGKNGQVARALATHDGTTCLGRDVADLTDPSACEAIIAATDADAVINAAAFTAVDLAEQDRDTAMIVNAMAPTAMAAAAAQRDIPFVHISTDYVFNGKGDAPFQPSDPPDPQNVYGISKLAGERGISAAGGAHVILRTSWVFSATGKNFVKSMIKLGSDNRKLRIVSDQIGGPTSASAIAAACIKIAKQLANDKSSSGIYHLSGKPNVSWAEFAREIFAQNGMATFIDDITSDDYPTPASRPLNSRLDCDTTKAIFDIDRPNWRDDLAGVLAELNADAAMKDPK